ncbi:MAG: uroporphyrinogen-III decarboxylase [Treponematales bacterium]
MTKKDLVRKALNNERPERVPVGFWFHCTEDEAADGFKSPEMFERSLAGQQRFYREFQPDLVKIMTDGFFIYPNEDFIHARSVSDLRRVRPLGPRHPWLEKQVEFAKTLTGLYAGEVFSFYNIFAPATLFKFARRGNGENPGKVLADFVLEDPGAARRAFDAAAEDLGALARRVVEEAGADGVYYSAQDIDDDRVTAELREEVFAPGDKAALAASGGVTILHICGHSGRRNNLAGYAGYPAHIFNWAVNVEGISLGEGKKLFGGRPVLGGFDNTAGGVLYRGAREAVEAKTERLLKEAGTSGVILGADCTVPMDIEWRRFNWVRDKAAAM